MSDGIIFYRSNPIRVCVWVISFLLIFSVTSAWCETISDVASLPRITDEFPKTAGTELPRAADTSLSTDTKLTVPGVVSKRTTPALVRPYCGLFCLFSAACLLEKPCDIKDFCDWRYVSPEGSTLNGLNRAAREKGLYSEIVDRSSIADIRATSVPAILHVTKKDGIRKYNHFVLLLKASEHYAWIFDPPESTQWVPIDDLEQRWDGSSLLISREPISHMSIAHRFYFRFLLGLGIVIVGTLVFRRFLRRLEIHRVSSQHQFFRASVTQLLSLVIAILLVAFLWNMFSARSLFGLSEEARHVQVSHGELFVDSVSPEKAKRLVGEEHPIIVDARLPGDYHTRHIEGAINIPVSLTNRQKEEALIPLDRTRTVMVYGRDKECRFANEVGSFMKSQGFERTLTINGGWKAWENRTRS
jgi:rhodanese-related sulfurtransferase